MNESVSSSGGHAGVDSKAALDVVVTELYQRLGKVAHNKLYPFGGGSLNTSELVHEVYLKFLAGQGIDAQSEEHFMAIAATAMRHIIIDRVRMRRSARRGGQVQFATLEESRLPWNDRAEEALVIHELIDRLAEIDGRLATTVECRYFAGYTEQETAAILDVNVRTVRRYWVRARNWLEQCYAQDAVASEA